MRQFFSRKVALLLSLYLTIVCSLLPENAFALTVLEVATDLACPCQCPLILKDCNMTCGLEWKNEIGRLIKKGMSKQEIMNYFIAQYGEEARLTTRQKIDGKIYQYTRDFDTVDWVLLWTGIGTWVALMFLGVYIGVRKLGFGRPRQTS